MSMSEDENDSFINPQFKYVFNCTQLIYKQNKSIERGGKIVLPLWVLESVDSMDIPFPYLFKLTNNSNNCSSHVGVLEFTAKDYQVSIPLWLMKNLGLKEEDKVTVESVSLPTATYCKLLPLTRNTAYISDTKQVLEENLRNFSCLTEGDILSIHEKNKIQIYKLKVAETKPEAAVCIFNCDVTLDMDLPEKCKRREICKQPPVKAQASHKLFPGKGYRLDEKFSDASRKRSVQSSPNKRKCEKTFLNFRSHVDPTEDNKDNTTRQNVGEPVNKRQCLEDNGESSINHLILIREKQKEFAKNKQSNNDADKFPGQGQSLNK